MTVRTALTRITLSDFRNHAAAQIDAGPGFVVLTGDNGAGKTNVLEAVSLLAPGRGLRRAALSDMARTRGPGRWAVSARLSDGTELGTGTGGEGGSADRRRVRVNGAFAPASQLAERVTVQWLTPAMDRLWVDAASGRRRWLDRLALGLSPGHATHATRYEAAMRERTRLLTGPDRPDPAWLSALEGRMDEHGTALTMARGALVEALADRLAASVDGPFARPALALAGWDGDNLADRLARGRARDAAAGRALVGPHRVDLLATHTGSGQPAAASSTGEQKAMLLSAQLAHADLVAERTGRAPVLLLDEVAAHLDPARRAALFDRLGRHGQVWMTGTEATLFNGLADACWLTVADGQVLPMSTNPREL